MKPSSENNFIDIQDQEEPEIHDSTPHSSPKAYVQYDEGLGQEDYEEQLLQKHAQSKGIRRDTMAPPVDRPSRKKKTMAVKEGILHVDAQDMLRLDRNGRSILHRAALDQNLELLSHLCDRAAEKIENHIVEFIDKKDLFENTPLLNACTNYHENEPMRRVQCIEKLLKADANPNVRTKITLWTPLTWSAFYSDVEALKTLLRHNAFAYWPDNKGLFPLDHLGLQVLDHIRVLLIFCRLKLAQAFIKKLLKFS